jgi:hypothetical protein
MEYHTAMKMNDLVNTIFERKLKVPEDYIQNDTTLVELKAKQNLAMDS